MMKKLLLMVCAAMLLFTGCVGTVAQEKSWHELSLKDTKGNTFALSSLKGKPTVIKLWSSWCSICLSGLKEYDELSALGLDANVISMVEPGRGAEMNEEDFVEWWNSLDDYENITVLLDTQELAKNEFFVRAYPTFVYLDANGEVVATRPGQQSTVQILETLASLEKE